MTIFCILLLQEIFRKIYENHNEEVYLKDVVVFLRAAYQDIDDIHDVRPEYLHQILPKSSRMLNVSS